MVALVMAPANPSLPRCSKRSSPPRSPAKQRVVGAPELAHALVTVHAVRQWLRAARSSRVHPFVVHHARLLQANPSAALALPRILRRARHLHSTERRLASEALYGLLRWGGLLDWVLRPTPQHRAQAHWLGWLVTQGFPSAEAAALSPVQGLPFERLENTAALASDLTGLAPIERLTILLGGTAALALAIHTSLGDSATAFVLASQQRGPVVLRAKPGHQRALVAMLCEQGIAAEPTSLATHGVRVRSRANLVGLAAYRQGLFEVQDEGSQLVAELVDPNATRVLDLCAGAGGKTLAIAARCPGAQLVAADVRSTALGELAGRAKRAGAQVQRVVLPSTGQLPPALLQAPFDQVVVDAPCSGTGTLRRQPHLRYGYHHRELQQLAATQGQLLARAAHCVAPGGRLVYATCSVLDLENQGVVDQFLATHPAFEQTPLPAILGPKSSELGGDVLQVAPHTHGTDGFYGAVLTRTGG